MEKFQLVLLNVWREACKHIEIRESTIIIASMLKKDFPLDKLLVQKINFTKRHIVTTATSVSNGKSIGQSFRTECSKLEMSKLKPWLREGGVSHWRADSERKGLVRALAPDEDDRDIIAISLSGSASCCGALVLIAEPKKTFSNRHLSLLGALRDPFYAALENDRQIRDMIILREAAEADKQSLLARMGREKLGDTIIGSQTGLNEVMARVRLVANSDAPVLIFGETGSGKELIARSIHNYSPRRKSAFIRVNCGAIPPELIDSQLFGHEKGSFTGASKRHKGWFERADGGSLLLDEIAELPAAAQVRLLRILQDGWLERVGGHEPIRVDVRIIAATHRDLAAMVAEGTFREDLWYRIAVFPVVLPPLRHRREDIPELVRHFAKRAAKRFGLVETMPTDKDITLMMSYDWPGNVREVAAVMDRAAILGDGLKLEVTKALGVTADFLPSVAPCAKEKLMNTAGAQQLMTLEDATRYHIEAGLRLSKGRVDGVFGAAELLDINPNTLRAKMRKLKIEWRQFR